MTPPSRSPSAKGGSRDRDREREPERGLLPRQQGMRKENYADLGTDEAESTLISNLEARASKTVPGVDGFRAAVPGERAPLGVDSLGKAFHDDGKGRLESNNNDDRGKRLSFKDMASKVQKMQRVANLRRQASNRLLQRSMPQAGHQRAHTLLTQINEGEDKYGADAATDFSNDPFGLEHTSMDFQGLDNLWNDDSTSKTGTRTRTSSSTSADYSQDNSEIQLSRDLGVSRTENASPESLPLISRNSDGTGRYSHTPEYSAVTECRRLARRNKISRRWESFRDCVHPVKIIKRTVRWILHSSLVVAALLFVAAWVLFYYFGNPEVDFLPGSPFASWWLNFVGRHLLLLELSRITQFILIDCLTLSSRLVVQILGPWVTMFCLQSKGWPFCTACWGLLSMILLHGDNQFQQHWLYFTGIKIYSSANSGSYIIASNAYLRVLIGLVLAGVATSLKRTVVTVYFGKRNFDTYKPKLEEILNDIIIISEVAELGAEADNLPDAGSPENAKNLVEANLKKRGEMSQARWSSVRFKKETRVRLDSDSSSVHGKLDSFDSSSMQGRNESVEQTSDTGTDGNKRKQLGRAGGLSRLDSSGRLRIKNLLDRWEEPVNKQDKATDSSVNDILKFRRALTYMDLEYPLGTGFGPASTRDELIVSAQSLYQRLLKLAPGSRILPHSVLMVLTENEDGTEDKEKRRSLKNLFRPDADDEVPILAFLQSCDTAYKKLRYFRASVGNSSVIDNVLENIIDTVYGFGLTLLILALLNLNPWPLLVSMSTLLVTFAFAIGPTAAKAIEGILLIVGRRPFDIGDRIIISDTPAGPVPGVANSWFVEDITLFSTTLRFGANNEVATVSNGSIAGSRITNCARSKNATVHILLKLHLHMHEGSNVDLFREALENFVLDNPSVWDSIVFLRCEEIDTDNEVVVYRLALRSRQSWQVSTRIFQDRARLHQFCTELAKKLDVAFHSPAPRRVLYYGGKLVDGAVKDYKKDLLMDGKNINSSGDLGPLLTMAQEAEEQESIRSAASGQTVSENEGAVLGQAPTEDNDAANDIFLAMVQQSHG